MELPFHLSDLQTLKRLQTTLSLRHNTWPAVITLVGSSRPQTEIVQQAIACYLAQLEPYAQASTFIVGGRGEHGSVMDINLDACYQREYHTMVVGVEPIFDLAGRIPDENVFAFKNISLRCYALTQLADLIIVFPGGLGTIQEIIVPLMHKKIDINQIDILNGPQAIFVATDEPNPVTEFLPILEDQRYISMTGSIPLIPVTVANFSTMLAHWLPLLSEPRDT